MCSLIFALPDAAICLKTYVLKKVHIRTKNQIMCNMNLKNAYFFQKSIFASCCKTSSEEQRESEEKEVKREDFFEFFLFLQKFITIGNSVHSNTQSKENIMKCHMLLTILSVECYLPDTKEFINSTPSTMGSNVKRVLKFV